MWVFCLHISCCVLHVRKSSFGQCLYLIVKSKGFQTFDDQVPVQRLKPTEEKCTHQTLIACILPIYRKFMLVFGIFVPLLQYFWSGSNKHCLTLLLDHLLCIKKATIFKKNLSNFMLNTVCKHLMQDFCLLISPLLLMRLASHFKLLD